MRLIVTLVTIIAFVLSHIYIEHADSVSDGWDGTLNGHVLAPDFPWVGAPVLDLEIRSEDIPRKKIPEVIEPRQSQWI
ncbi:MAG: hypothetical protein WAZ27_00135 [Minisyncoccia bacterium]